MARSYERLRTKHDKIQLDILFLTTCLEEDIIPKFLFFRTASNKCQFSRSYRKAQLLFLRDEIKDKRKELNLCIRQLQVHTEECHSGLSNLCFLALQSTCNTNQVRVNNVTKSQHFKKLSQLKRSQKPNSTTINNDEFVINLSVYQLSDEEKRVLSYGLQYSLPSKRPRFDDLLLPAERLCNSLNRNYTIPSTQWTEVCDNLRVPLQKTCRINQFVNRRQKKQYDYDMTVLQRLRSNKDIIICQPDKGNAVVIINKCDYISKIEAILSDKTKFEINSIEINSINLLKLTVSLENKIYRYLCEIKPILETNGKSLLDLQPSGTHPGILYGVPKIHKQSVPMRPILSCTGCHNLKLSQYAAELLQPLINKSYISRDCYHFLDDLKEAKLPTNCVLASFDIESLFTNILVKETVVIATNLAFPTDADTSYYRGFSKKEFKKLLTFMHTKYLLHIQQQELSSD